MLHGARLYPESDAPGGLIEATYKGERGGLIEATYRGAPGGLIEATYKGARGGLIEATYRGAPGGLIEATYRGAPGGLIEATYEEDSPSIGWRLGHAGLRKANNMSTNDEGAAREHAGSEHGAAPRLPRVETAAQGARRWLMVAGVVAGCVAFGAGEATYEWIRPENGRINTMGNVVLAPTTETAGVAEVKTRHWRTEFSACALVAFSVSPEDWPDSRDRGL